MTLLTCESCGRQERIEGTIPLEDLAEKLGWEKWAYGWVCPESYARLMRGWGNFVNYVQTIRKIS